MWLNTEHVSPIALYCPKCGENRYHIKAGGGKVECVQCKDTHFKTAPPTATDWAKQAANDREER